MAEMDQADFVFTAPPGQLYAYPRPNVARRKKLVEHPLVASANYESLLCRTALVRSVTYRESKLFLTSPDDVAKLLQHLATANQEHVITIPVDARMRPVAVYETAIGARSQALVAFEDILRVVLLTSAGNFFLAHNHPSGSCAPSEEDREMARGLDKAARCIGLNLLDWFVVADDCWFSSKSGVTPWR